MGSDNFPGFLYGTFISLVVIEITNTPEIVTNDTHNHLVLMLITHSL